MEIRKIVYNYQQDFQVHTSYNIIIYRNYLKSVIF